jgi:myo-inositol-1(or 4)-monophosphatase
VLNTAKQADIVKPDLKTVIVLLKHIIIRLLHRTQGDYAKQIKPDGSIVTEIDQAMQAEISEALQERWPGYGFIGEEMSFDDQVSISETNPQGYWVLDPLDGTTNFTSNFLFYGVSLALVIDGEPVLAVVYDPVRDECFSAAKGAGAFLNDSLLVCPSTRSLDRCIANVDYKRLVGDLSAQLVRCPPYRSQRNLGSSVLEWCWLAAGRIQLYLHGGQKLWDFAAGYLILLEAGGAATSLSGMPLDCSKLRKRSVVAAVNKDLLDKWVQWIDANSEISQSAPF